MLLHVTSNLLCHVTSKSICLLKCLTIPFPGLPLHFVQQFLSIFFALLLHRNFTPYGYSCSNPSSSILAYRQLHFVKTLFFLFDSSSPLQFHTLPLFLLQHFLFYLLSFIYFYFIIIIFFHIQFAITQSTPLSSHSFHVLPAQKKEKSL